MRPGPPGFTTTWQPRFQVWVPLAIPSSTLRVAECRTLSPRPIPVQGLTSFLPAALYPAPEGTATGGGCAGVAQLPILLHPETNLRARRHHLPRRSSRSFMASWATTVIPHAPLQATDVMELHSQILQLLRGFKATHRRISNLQSVSHALTTTRCPTAKRHIRRLATWTVFQICTKTGIATKATANFDASALVETIQSL